ncbi:hypothetical protein VTK73DRAFT_2961 [Phialemonium thermophilum]|uniref:ABM domain-containing protein n=1 Tax=Phialemonium thermophilum TaxID=223376 RepID=A0ABR3X1P7_9PEZI
MAVTELAILTSTNGELSGELRKLLEQARPIQAAWHAENFPALPSTPAERGDAMFQQMEDPRKILLTARWDSVAGHHQWIASEDNKAIMAKLNSHIDSDDLVLFHLDSEIFSAPPPDGATGLVDSPVISVARLMVAPNQRKNFGDKFEEVRNLLEDYAKPHLVRTGWRVDKEHDARDEFVVVCGWDTVQRHLDFAHTAEFLQYREILGFLDGSDIKHYQRFL